jgi:hypothetical protein
MNENEKKMNNLIIEKKRLIIRIDRLLNDIKIINNSDQYLRIRNYSIMKNRISLLKELSFYKIDLDNRIYYLDFQIDNEKRGF